MLDSLAPRRRRLIYAVTVVVLVGAVVGGIVAATGGGSTKPVRPVAQNVPGPVLLIPGFGESIGSLRTLEGHLRAAGKTVTIVDLPDQAIGDINAQARTLRTAVNTALTQAAAAGSPARSVDLVGYSDGGVVARVYVKDLGGGSTVRRVVTLGSPQHGTDLAATALALVPGICSGACAQVQPGSDLLDHLNRGDETPAGPTWVSMWTTQDRTVVPPDSAHLDGAVNIVLQQVCSDEKVSHGGLPADPLVTGIVLASLGTAAPVAPTSGQCAALRTAGSRS